MPRKKRAPYTPSADYDLGPARMVEVRPETLLTAVQRERLARLSRMRASEMSAADRDERARLLALAGGMVATARAAHASGVEPVPEDANGRKRRFHKTALREMFEKGLLEKRQHDALDDLGRAWERAQGQGHGTLGAERVDRSIDFDGRTLITILKVEAYGRLRREIPQMAWDVVEHVVLRDRRLRDGLCRDGAQAVVALELLRHAGDVLARAIENPRKPRRPV